MISIHQQRVLDFMRLAGAEVNSLPSQCSDKQRLLDSRLIAEEAKELLAELGYVLGEGALVSNGVNKLDLSRVAKEAADLIYVVTYMLCSMGIDEAAIVAAVDANNLDKFGPGHGFRADGKLLPPANFVKVDLSSVLEIQDRLYG